MDSGERDALFAACSNAGRWGPEDEMGTLNLIGPETRRGAAQLVVERLSVSMAADLSLPHTPSTDDLQAHTGDRLAGQPDRHLVTRKRHGG